jgi:hypothetical protein
MPYRVFRIMLDDLVVASASGPEEVAMTLKGAWPGRYELQEASRPGELLPSGYSCQRWGVATRHADGTVTPEPEPVPVKS